MGFSSLWEEDKKPNRVWEGRNSPLLSILAEFLGNEWILVVFDRILGELLCVRSATLTHHRWLGNKGDLTHKSQERSAKTGFS